MSQPKWKLIANLGDVNPIDYGGYFIYIDETGVYDPEAELLIAPEDEDEDGNGEWTIYRFELERCTYIDGILSDNRFHPELSAWFAQSPAERAERPQDTTNLANVASFIDSTEDALQTDLCSDDPIARAHAYRAIGDYHGFENFDSYPITLRNRAEVEARYAEEIA